MDYEKEYKELVGKIDKAYLYAQTDSTRAVLEDIRPELREVGDEEVRKAMIDFFKHEREEGITVLHYGVDVERMIAWLEKRGEQRPTENKGMNLVEEEMTPFQKKVFCIIDATIEEEQGLKQVCDELLALASNEIEQKPTEWSEGDEEEFQIATNALVEAGQYDSAHWLKSLKGRVQLQPKREWSERDNKMLGDAIFHMEETIKYRTNKAILASANDVLFWLKSLKDRMTWKPSGEQMKALFELLPTRCSSNPVFSLYNDLKKLMEE